MELDVLLLVESFRPICDFTLQTFGIHPSHFYMLPSLAMSCCLKGLHDEGEDKYVELLQDMEMIKFVSAGTLFK